MKPGSSGKPTVQPSVNREGVISRTSVLEVSHPVFSDTGTNLGGIGTSLRQSKLAVTQAADGATGPVELMTFDRDGQVLTSTDGLETAGPVLPRDRALKALFSDHPALMRRMLAHGSHHRNTAEPPLV